MDKFVVHIAKAPPAADYEVSDAELPPTRHSSVALMRTWGQLLFGVVTVTGPHCWFRSAVGCVLGVTHFSPYVKTVAERCIDLSLIRYKEMGVSVVKAGETYVDRGDKRPTEGPTYNPHVFMFGHADRLPILTFTVLAAELIEKCMIDYLRKVFICANQREEGPGSYGDKRVQGISSERPATFYLAPVRKFIVSFPRYLEEMNNKVMIEQVKLQRRTGSADIRSFARNSVNENSPQVPNSSSANVKSDESSDDDLVSKLQELFLPAVVDEIFSSNENPAFLNMILKNIKSDGLGNHEFVGPARYKSIKNNSGNACPGLIISNHSDSYGEILGAFRTIRQLTEMVGTSSGFIQVDELKNAGLDGIPIRMDTFRVRLIHPSDSMTLEQVITNCDGDPRKKIIFDRLNALAKEEVQEDKKRKISIARTDSHVKIVCKAIFPHEPDFARIFEMAPVPFAQQFMSGESRILNVTRQKFVARLDEGGPNGATFPASIVRMGMCKGKHFPAFTAYLVNPVTGQAHSEEERAAYAIRKMKQNPHKNKKSNLNN